MATHYDNILQLTSPSLSAADTWLRLGQFSHDLGWRPSDQLEEPLASDFATAHLLVEHGLENTAVLSFLRRPRNFLEFGMDEKSRLLSLSYNNLVDWHVVIEAEAVNYVYVRTRVPTIVEREIISRDKVERLRSEVFEAITERRPNPNVPALDDALIRTISFWKRSLAAELRYVPKNENISALFNSIMFVRAIEDLRARTGTSSSIPLLRHSVQTVKPGRGLSHVLREAVESSMGLGHAPAFLDAERLGVFDALDGIQCRLLIEDFYVNRHAPYPYDFCLMSKHALSRIYEHYVSMLREEETPQLSFVPVLPKEHSNKSSGTVYTPHYIARFFARFLREQLPPTVFRQIRSIDPACGSGMFLRTLLELQAESARDFRSNPVAIGALFENVSGIDSDANAIEASRLSLTLLHLALTGSAPQKLDLRTLDAFEYLDKFPHRRGSVDAILMNPPFVSLEAQTPATREKLRAYLGDSAVGRQDTYLGFIQLAMELLGPGGYGLFVLPHNFLLGKNAAPVRRLIADSAWVRALIDLSAVDVFEGTGVYVILLIFQKKLINHSGPAAMIVRCSESPGRALQAAVEGQRIESSAYAIYDVDQEQFQRDSWLMLPPSESSIRTKMLEHPSLDTYLDIKQGIVTGADRVFIIPATDVPVGEEKIFMEFLPDRDMHAYVVPEKASLRVFHPFEGSRLLDDDELRDRYPKTWKYLEGHQTALQRRKPLARYRKAWWEPMWPRPESVRRKKIVAPHLALMPRFAADLSGRYAVSHGPMFVVRETGASEDDLIKFFCAVLNSSACYWYVSKHSHTYRNGYALLEPKTLRKTPVPDPAKVPTATMKKLLRLVDETISRDGLVENERRLDRLVCDLYRLSKSERILVGCETED